MRVDSKAQSIFGSLALLTVLALPGFSSTIDRRVLPIKAPWIPTIHTEDARDAKAPPVFQVEAPKGAPNVVIIMWDDLGFGGTSAFGSTIQTPHMDKLAETGLKYNQFHTTALCSPTRQALKTGRNHHSCNQAKITEVATAFPGATGQLPDDVAPLAKMLQMNGWSTSAFGKWHETAVWEISPSGPMVRWPNQQGFDKFYGFMGGETNQWKPTIYDNQNPIEPPDEEGYHFMSDMTTQSINWMRFQQALTPDKPFFIYFTPGAVHAPHHVPKSYIKKYAGKFDEGWDVIRERIFNQQKKLGVIPKNTKLAKKPADIKDWKDLSPKEKKLFARQAEVFAGFVEMTDYETGRLVKAIEDLGELDNTLIFFIGGDNGTSAEGGMTGLYNEMAYFNNEPKGSDVDVMMNFYDAWGDETTYPHMAAGWAVAFDSPFTWTKQVASNYGGTRDSLVIHWPKGIKTKGQLRSQWHHVIDVAPTVLEACQLPEPRIVNGVPQRPIEGTSMLYSFNDAKAPDRHQIQYFEMLGNRGIYYDGWFAGTVHLKPWGKVENRFTEDKWELYHVAEDFSMSTDLAKKHPEALERLKGVFKGEALKYNVFPLDDRRQELFNPELAGRPDLMFGRKTLTLYEGMGSLLENDFINVKNSSLEIVAEVQSKGKTDGVIIQQGGRFGGWSLYVKDNKPVYVYNYLGLKTYKVEGQSSLPQGKSTVKLDFDYDGGKPGAGGNATLFVDGKKAGAGRVEQTQPNIFSADETANVGKDMESMVTEDYTLKTSHFSGKINKVTITLKDSN
jgi:arylsulfatase A-like enzyme